jgi:hypothetical protein
MAHDVARCILELARDQERREALAARAATRRSIRFQAYYEVKLVGNGDDGPDDETTIVGDVCAPAMVLFNSSDPRDTHWYLEYEGTRYDITAFPDGVRFVLRCIVDTLLYRLDQALEDNGANGLDAHLEVELCAHTRFGRPRSGTRVWSHCFGRLFEFGSTYARTYEGQLQRYVLTLGRHIVNAGQAVTMLPA